MLNNPCFWSVFNPVATQTSQHVIHQTIQVFLCQTLPTRNFRLASTTFIFWEILVQSKFLANVMCPVGGHATSRTLQSARSRPPCHVARRRRATTWPPVSALPRHHVAAGLDPTSPPCPSAREAGKEDQHAISLPPGPRSLPRPCCTRCDTTPTAVRAEPPRGALSLAASSCSAKTMGKYSWF